MLHTTIQRYSFRFAYLISLLAAIFLFSSCEKPAGPDAPITYSNGIAPMMTNYCTNCHSGAGAFAGLDLRTYANVRKAAEQGALLQRVNDPGAPMPPNGLLSSAEREKIERWIESGFPQ
ncbi:MAG: c-type cytochrome domain-containing protein [Bacteroidota bacterium]